MPGGLGAFFYLPLSVGTTHQLPPAPQPYQRTVVHRQTIDGISVLITDDGFVGVGDQTLEATTKVVNAILATALTWGLPIQVISDPARELCTYREMGRSIIHLSAVNGPSGRNSVSIERDTNYSLWSVYQRFSVTLSQISQIITRARDYLRAPSALEDLILLAQGWSLKFDQKAGKAAFLYGWMVIEAMLDRMWDQYVGSLQRTSEERKSLRNAKNWTASHYSEVLAQVGRIPDAARRRLDALRKVRNEVVHERREPTNAEVQSCMNVAKKVVINSLSGGNLFAGVT